MEYCNECEQVVEGDTIEFTCPNCTETWLICRHCKMADVVDMSEDDPRQDR